MRTPSFLLLYLLVLGGLLGLRGALVRWQPVPGERARTPEVNAEGVMALPPKPEGATAQAAGVGAEGTARLTPDGCRGMSPTVREVCWQALARQTAAADPDGALAICTEITTPELTFECQADVAETIAPRDRDHAAAICDPLPSVKWRGQCHFGVGLALAEVDSAYALGRCDHAEAFRLFCRHDVVGEVALVDLDAAMAFCAREEGDALARKTCWHGIGKYLARRSLAEATAACDAATMDWRGNCFHGAGWGAAERDADAALAGCLALPLYADNCRQGVAHQLKRADPARAVALCEAIPTETIRSRCLDFVTR